MNDYLKELMKDANQGDVDAMFEVAHHIVFEDFTKPIAPDELALAQRFYRAACAEGDSRSMLDVGAMYYNGRGVEQDFQKAMHWYQKAADKGDVMAMNNLGYCYYYGRSVPIDYEKAYRCFTCAALLGSINSLYKVGDMYCFGKHVPKSVDIAFRIYDRCYDNIDEDEWCLPDVCLRLGNCYRNGEGTPVNLAIAGELLLQATQGFEKRVKEGDRFSKSSLESARRALEEVKKAMASDAGQTDE